MKISVDGGGFCLPAYKRFGNYTFSMNIMQALSEYDHDNSYMVYSFCSRPNDLVLRENFFYRKLVPKFLWMSARVSFDEIIAPKNIFLALNQAIPAITFAKIIGFSHGMSFKLMPHYYKDSYKKMCRQMDGLFKRSQYVIVSSTRVKEEMSRYYGKYERKIQVLPFGIPFDFTTVAQKKREKFFLYVGMNHPIKNVKMMVDVFEKFRLLKKEYNNFRLYLVGPFTGLKRSHPYIRTYAKMKREDLKILYQKATAYVSTSHYESFNLPALEALSQNCPVIGLESAIIPEMAPYVNVCDNESDFLQQMELMAQGKVKKINRENLGKDFSWETYATTLKTLYKTLI